MTSYQLTHLKQLEAESIHIIREVAAEFERPVMLYSVGKDSTVMLQLALKAFFPGKPPFPLLHIDSTWEFREMYEFRDRRARTGAGSDRSHQRGRDRAGNQPLHPRQQETHRHPENRGAQTGARQIPLRRGLRRRSPRRGKIPRQGAHLFVSRSKPPLGSQEPAPGIMESLQRQDRQGRVDPGISLVQLDRTGYLAIHPSGKYSASVALFSQGTSRCSARRYIDHGR